MKRISLGFGKERSAQIADALGVAPVPFYNGRPLVACKGGAQDARPLNHEGTVASGWTLADGSVVESAGTRNSDSLFVYSADEYARFTDAATRFDVVGHYEGLRCVATCSCGTRLCPGKPACLKRPRSAQERGSSMNHTTGLLRGTRYPLVQVVWLDSSSPNGRWVALSEWTGPGSLECVSVGYLIAEDNRSKTLAPHLAYPDDDQNRQGNGIMTIPLGAIVSVCELVVPNACGPPTCAHCDGPLGRNSAGDLVCHSAACFLAYPEGNN